MKRHTAVIAALAAAVALTGCVAVPYSDGAYYGPSYTPVPAASVGVYVAPPVVYYGGGYRSGHYHSRPHHRSYRDSYRRH